MMTTVFTMTVIEHIVFIYIHKITAMLFIDDTHWSSMLAFADMQK